MERLDADAELDASAFHADSTRASERQYQGHFLREAWGEWRDERRAFAAGTVVVPVHQPLGRLIVILLEPRSDDGFLTWNLLDEAMEASGSYPIARVRELPTKACEECARFR
jgi:hypothetical protein